MPCKHEVSRNVSSTGREPLASGGCPNRTPRCIHMAPTEQRHLSCGSGPVAMRFLQDTLECEHWQSVRNLCGWEHGIC
jgi:hypothetical protein